MKDLGQINYCLGLQFEHLNEGQLFHQSTYIKKILKQINMDNAYPITSSMEIRSLENSKYIFGKRLEHEPIARPILGSKNPIS